MMHLVFPVATHIRGNELAEKIYAIDRALTFRCQYAICVPL